MRESKVLRNRKGEKMSQTFLCSRGGVRDYRGLTIENQKWEQKNETRCECKAKFRVHIDYFARRWYVSKWTDDYNHKLLDEKLGAMLLIHRKLNDSDIMQIDHFRRVTIRPTQILGSFACIVGGYDKIRYRKKAIHNQIG